MPRHSPPATTSRTTAPLPEPSPSAASTISSLRFNSAATGAITIGAADTLTISSGSFGGILLTPAVTTIQQINGGSLTTTGTELIVQHYGTGELDIGSNITGAIGFTKSGPGRVVLSGSNTYTGATVINGGTVSVASLTGTTNMGTGTIVLGNGTLEYTGGASQSLPATRTFTLAGAHGLTGATISVTDPAVTLTILGAISGNQVSSLTKAGAGTLAMNVSSSTGYTGDTIISNGTILAGNINAFGNATAQTGRVILGDANTGSNNVALLFTLSTGTFPQQVTVSNQGTGTATVGMATGTVGGMVFNSELFINRSVNLQSPASGTLQFTNRIGGAGDVIVNSQGTGSINFFRAQGPNIAADWVGNLILNPGSTLVLGSPAGAINCDKSIPNTANVVFNTGSTMQLSPGTQLGYETVNALVSSSSPTDGLIDKSSGAGSFQLTIGGGGGSGDFRRRDLELRRDTLARQDRRRRADIERCKLVLGHYNCQRRHATGQHRLRIGHREWGCESGRLRHAGKRRDARRDRHDFGHDHRQFDDDGRSGRDRLSGAGGR